MDHDFSNQFTLLNTSVVFRVECDRREHGVHVCHWLSCCGVSQRRCVPGPPALSSSRGLLRMDLLSDVINQWLRVWSEPVLKTAVPPCLQIRTSSSWSRRSLIPCAFYPSGSIISWFACMVQMMPIISAQLLIALFFTFQSVCIWKINDTVTTYTPPALPTQVPATEASEVTTCSCPLWGSGPQGCRD